MYLFNAIRSTSFESKFVVAKDFKNNDIIEVAKMIVLATEIMINAEAFSNMSALVSMQVWATHNGCSSNPIVSTVTTGDGTASSFYQYLGCDSGIIVEHYTISD
jgi:hypothetical protein